MGFLTGKPATSTSNSQSNSQSTQSSAANNQYYPQAQTTFGGTAGQTGAATGAMGALLGVGGDPAAQNAAFQNYRNSTGYNFQMDQGQQAIAGSQAARGLLDSGSTAKALLNFGQGQADSSFNNYLGHLQGLAGTGIQAGNLIAGTGQQSKSQGQSNSTSTSTGQQQGGKKGLLDYGAEAAGHIAASDRRLKKNIQWVSRLKNGLDVYTYDYINGSGPHTGVMADQVRDVLPDALGPIIGGYMTVDYSKIGA